MKDGKCTSELFCQASQNRCGVSVFSGAESVLLRHRRAQVQHVGELLESILERRGSNQTTGSQHGCGDAERHQLRAKRVVGDQTLVGRGHSSSKRVMTAGPSGSSRGITRINDWTTSSQPSSKTMEINLAVSTFLN